MRKLEEEMELKKTTVIYQMKKGGNKKTDKNKLFMRGDF